MRREAGGGPPAWPARPARALCFLVDRLEAAAAALLLGAALTALTLAVDCPAGHVHCQRPGPLGLRCLAPAFVCDGYDDCPGRGSRSSARGPPTPDEEGCAGRCRPDARPCDGRCRPAAYWCDGNKDCVDGADEVYCDLIRPGLRICPGSQVHRDGQLFCDGRPDCKQGVDEHQCEARGCGGGALLCRDLSPRGRVRCLHARARCDGVQDCRGGEDERGCSSGVLTGSVVVPAVPSSTGGDGWSVVTRNYAGLTPGGAVVVPASALRPRPTRAAPLKTSWSPSSPRYTNWMTVPSPMTTSTPTTKPSASSSASATGLDDHPENATAAKPYADEGNADPDDDSSGPHSLPLSAIILLSCGGMALLLAALGALGYLGVRWCRRRDPDSPIGILGVDIATSFVFMGSVGFHKRVTVEDADPSPRPSSVLSPEPSHQLDPGQPHRPQCPQCLLECPRCPPCPRCCPVAAKQAVASVSADPVEQIPAYAFPVDEHVYDIPHAGASLSFDAIADPGQGPSVPVHRYDEPCHHRRPVTNVC